MTNGTPKLTAWQIATVIQKLDEREPVKRKIVRAFADTLQDASPMFNKERFMRSIYQERP